MNSPSPSPSPNIRRRLRARVVPSLAALILLVANACGSSTPNEPQATGATSETSSPVSSDGETGDGGSENASGADDASIPTTGDDSNRDPAAPSEAEAEESRTPTTPVSAELAHDCVPPGGTQTITIRSEPRVAVGYQSTYSDRRKGGSNASLSEDEPSDERTYGGNSGGITDESGRWTDTWTVNPRAPHGPVEVQAFAMGHETTMGAIAVTFEVAGDSGVCP